MKKWFGDKKNEKKGAKTEAPKEEVKKETPEEAEKKRVMEQLKALGYI